MDLSWGKCECRRKLECAEQNAGIPERDEMFDLLDDIISDNAQVDLIGAQSSNVQYDELFTVLNSEVYPEVFFFIIKLLSEVDALESNE